MSCGDPDIVYPLIADVYYPIVTQSAYGDTNKRWVLNKTVACYFNTAGIKSKQQITPDVELMQDNVLLGRTKCDVRFSAEGDSNAMTNVIISNIRDIDGNPIYLETSGIRNGKSTIFEIASNGPIVGPFGKVEYYRIVIRRSENQGADI